MKITKRHTRAARKLVLPVLAIGLMTVMMYLGSGERPRPVAGKAASAAARVPHGLPQR